MPKGEMKGKWRSEKWKFLIQGNYSKKARSCEQAFVVICGNVANRTSYIIDNLILIGHLEKNIAPKI